MTVAPLTDLPLWPPTNLDRDPLVPLDAGERRRFAGPVTRVRLPTDATAWLVTRHADVRQMLRHPGFSADLTRPGSSLLRKYEPVQGLLARW